MISKLTRRDEQEEEREPLLLLPFLPRCMMVAVMVKAAAVRPVVLLPLPPVFPWWSREETPVAVLHTTGSTDATELLARSSSRFTEPEAKLASYRSTCKLSLTTISFSISSLFFFWPRPPVLGALTRQSLCFRIVSLMNEALPRWNWLATCTSARCRISKTCLLDVRGINQADVFVVFVVVKVSYCMLHCSLCCPTT